MGVIESRLDELLAQNDLVCDGDDDDDSDIVSHTFVELDHDYYAADPEKCLLHYLGG